MLGGITALTEGNAPMPLKDTQIRNAKPKEKPYKLSDSGGLYVYITPSGGKLWRLKYRLHGTEKTLSIGKYPEISIAEARKQQGEAKERLRQGIDPSQFKKQAAKNRAAIVEPLAFGELLRAIWGYQGGLLTRLALRLLALTALRPGEVRHLEWAEVDLDNALISISAGKMKMRRGHVVPLSTQALDLLTKLKEAGGGYGTYVFPCEGNSRGVMSDNTLNAALRRLGYDTQEQHCAHGFRSSFSSMAHNSRKWQYEAIEAALSHMHGSDVAMIYNRSAYLAERKELMQWWADECDKMRESMGTYGKA